MSKQTVYEFVNAINAHDINELYSLMTDDHRFIDSHGNKVEGRDQMKIGWKGYFQLFPDYKIEVADIFETDDKVGAFGFASGTYAGKRPDSPDHWRLPAAWKAVVKDCKINLWQVYADTKIPFAIIERNKKG